MVSPQVFNNQQHLRTKVLQAKGKNERESKGTITKNESDNFTRVTRGQEGWRMGLINLPESRTA